jgi:ATP-dependent helicase/nuclease subunit B
MARARARVFTIPASARFLPTLIGALLDGRLVPGFPGGDDPLALASATLYLPTRRACRLARDAFLDAMKGDAAILPRILPIGDIDEDEIAFAEAATGASALEMPDALGRMERKILLAELIEKWATSPEMRTAGGVPLVANNPVATLALADDLARLQDDMTTRGVTSDKLDGLVPDDLDAYWQLTLRFLKIAREEWPKLRDERGAIEPARRRDLLIAAEEARLQGVHSGPVIAAGSTGSMPSTAALLSAIAHLPNGAVVLPGLDTDLDEASWDLIGGVRNETGETIVAPAAGHPQFAMHGLLRRIDIAREDVQTLGKRAPHGRETFVSEALRPALTTELWRERIGHRQHDIDAAMAGLTVIEAANAEDEAIGIATVLREAVDDGSAESRARTAALITPDRALARRVLAALDRWEVPVDDSGGDSLADTPAGIFARIAAQVALGGTEPVTLLALLKHPLFRLGAHPSAHDGAVAALERAVLRGPRPKKGSSGLAHALQTFRREQASLHGSDLRKTLSASELDAAVTLTAKLSAALAPLESLSTKSLTLADIAARHREVIETLSRDAQGLAAAFADASQDGKALAAMFSDISETGAARSVLLRPADYLESFHALAADRMVRRPGAPGARVRILGPLEARLQQADHVVLGGLVEGVWPPEAHADPWLSRPMRQKLGLDLPERRVGLSAHDFAQGLGAQKVVLTRAAKLAGAPTVASRFLQRLAAVAGEARWNDAVARGESYLQWGRSLDMPAHGAEPCARPEPKPPRDARPLSLSVTEIEHWLRDPYTIYARHILRLRPLDDVDTPPGARDRGVVIHEAIGEFTKNFASALPADPLTELLTLGRRYFAALEDYPEAKAFWWPRFERIARWFVDWEHRRRVQVASIDAEIDGRIEFAAGQRMFRLRARADRIEHLADGRYAILDYKTGRIPGDREVRAGLAPQLTLEAAILRHGGFGKAEGASLGELVYVALKGGREGGEDKAVGFKDSSPDDEAEKALAKLKTLVNRFENEQQPYLPLVASMWKTHYGDYDHLARVKEWSANGGGDDGE